MMHRLLSRPVRRERALTGATVAYLIGLIVLAVYFGHGSITDAKLTAVALAFPAACVLAVWLGVAWHRLEDDR